MSLISLCIGLLRRPGAIRRRFAYGRSPVPYLDVFSTNPCINKPIQLSKNYFIFVSHTNKTVSKNKDAEIHFSQINVPQ